MISKITRLSSILLSSGRRLGRPDILFWTLPYLIILILVGTIAQKEIGLYQAQKVFFSSFFFEIGGMPIPAGYSVLSLLSLNLFCKFLFLSEWKKAKIGIHITHLSIIILMVGGLLTATSAREGYIALKDGETGHIIRDYHNKELLIGDMVFDWNAIENTDFSALPFTIEILQTCQNTAIRPRSDRELNTNDGIGAASMAELVCIEPLIEYERNVAGITYRVTNSENADENGTYIVFEDRQTTDTVMGMDIILDRQRRSLPFDIQLNRFNRDVYPGTNMPREYESRVTIRDGDITWPARIAMNEPLRYGGYTFYQSSVSVNKNGEPVSVLSAVKNTGWLFPYLSGIVMIIGLIVHILIRYKII